MMSGKRNKYTDQFKLAVISFAGDKTFTKGGSMRAPSLVIVCEWFREAWQQLDPAIIRKAFLKCGISNALDGTEDDYLWHEPDSVPETSVDSDDPLDGDNNFYDDAQYLRF